MPEMLPDRLQPRSAESIRSRVVAHLDALKTEAGQLAAEGQQAFLGLRDRLELSGHHRPGGLKNMRPREGGSPEPLPTDVPPLPTPLDPGNDVPVPFPGDTHQPPAWAKDTVWYQIFPERFNNGDPRNDAVGLASNGNLRSDWNANFADPRTPKIGYNDYFGGDVEGIIQKMPYLKDLGVSGIYLNPLAISPTNHKYAWTDWKKLDPQFQSTDPAKDPQGAAQVDKLLDVAHQNGIRVMFDFVYNHTSDQHWAFQNAMANGPSSPTWNFYHIDGTPVVQNPPNYWTYGGFGGMPQLDVAGNTVVQNNILDSIKFWLGRTDSQGKHVDGARYDVALNIQSPDFWRKVRATEKSVNPDVYTIFEAWENHGDNGLPSVQNGDQADAVMNYGFYQNMQDYFAHDAIDTDAFDQHQEDLRGHFPQAVTAAEFNLLGSHDTSRFLFEAGGDKAKLKLAALYQMGYVGSPVIYYGDEIGMTGGNDPDNRRPMAWNDPDQSLHDYYKQLIALRAQHPALRSATYPTTLMRNNDLGQMVSMRTDGQEKVLVVTNKGQNPNVALNTGTTLDPAVSFPDGTRFQDLLSGATYTSQGGQLQVPVGAKAGTYLQVLQPGQ